MATLFTSFAALVPSRFRKATRPTVTSGSLETCPDSKSWAVVTVPAPSGWNPQPEQEAPPNLPCQNLSLWRALIACRALNEHHQESKARRWAVVVRTGKTHGVAVVRLKHYTKPLPQNPLSLVPIFDKAKSSDSNHSGMTKTGARYRARSQNYAELVSGKPPQVWSLIVVPLYQNIDQKPVPLFLE